MVVVVVAEGLVVEVQAVMMVLLVLEVIVAQGCGRGHCGARRAAAAAAADGHLLLMVVVMVMKVGMLIQ